jgi:hypothetical protein
MFKSIKNSSSIQQYRIFKNTQNLRFRINVRRFKKKCPTIYLCITKKEDKKNKNKINKEKKVERVKKETLKSKQKNEIKQR